MPLGRLGHLTLVSSSFTFVDYTLRRPLPLFHAPTSRMKFPPRRDRSFRVLYDQRTEYINASCSLVPLGRLNSQALRHTYLKRARPVQVVAEEGLGHLPLVSSSASWRIRRLTLRRPLTLWKFSQNFQSYIQVPLYQRTANHKWFTVLWCRGRDLNPHDLAIIRTWSVRVCQFHHPGLIYYVDLF